MAALFARRIDVNQKSSDLVDKSLLFVGAGSEIRTYNPLITNEMPYR